MLWRLASAVKDSGSWSEVTRANCHQLHQNTQQTYMFEGGLDKDAKNTAVSPQWLRSTTRFNWLWCLLLWFWDAVYGKITRKLPKRNSTSYFNGLRGIACTIVYTHHFAQLYYISFNNPYGAEPAEENHGVSQLPLVRMIYAGKGMVAIFFVLTGFVLTISPLRKIINYSTISTNDLTNCLCISILRRGIRLYMPMFILAFITCLVTWYHPIFSYINWRKKDPTFLQHLWHFVQVMKPTLDPFPLVSIYHPAGLQHCWTIPISVRGSMVLYLMCVATARLTTRARKLVVIGVALWHLHFKHGDMFCLLSGMFLAELRHCPLSRDFTFLSKCKIPRLLGYTLSICIALLSLLVMGWPENGDAGVEPFYTIAKFTPEIWKADKESETLFWSYVTAPILLLTLENLPPAQRLLSTKPLLYLGEISFPFYLLHWLAFNWPGKELMEYIFYVWHFQMDVCFYIAHFVILVLLIIVAACVGKPVDDRCVKMSKDFVNWLVGHGDPNQQRRENVQFQSL